MVEVTHKKDLVKVEADKQQMVEALVGQAVRNQNLYSVEAGTTSSRPRIGEETTHHQAAILVEVEVAVDHLEVEAVDQGHGMDMEVKDLVVDPPKPCCTA